ncbi:thioesterase domain-containing protein [Kitasatospora sp. NPDC059088]|uniref:thioesterase domain-containing protein n=1 Tax=Kitasatospora sp. NPDC059088 TaxID=3346722 RepID=UPI0036AB1404
MGSDIVGELAAALGCDDPAVVRIDRDHHRLTVPVGPSGDRFTVDVLGDPRTADRVAHLLPGGGLNVAANYCTAQGRSLARFLADHGCLVLGTTPREDALTPERIGPRCADWGLDGQLADLERVVTAACSVTGLPYELLGHSAGAALALTAAARLGGEGPRRVLVLDTTGPYDREREPELLARAEELHELLEQRLTAGEWTVDPGLKGLFARASTAPDAPSGLPRPVDGAAPFSNLGLLHYALTRTRDLPGPTNWIHHRGHSTGGYTFGAAPAEDRFALAHSPLPVWQQAVARLGSGLQPTALLRDLAALWSGRAEPELLDWAAIRAEVVWLNAEFGRGDHDLGARLIDRGGAEVDYRVVPDYGHGDMVWSATAERDVWGLLLPLPRPGRRPGHR